MTSLVEDPPPVASLNGLDLRLEIDSDVWEQTVPPGGGEDRPPRCPRADPAG